MPTRKLVGILDALQEYIPHRQEFGTPARPPIYQHIARALNSKYDRGSVRVHAHEHHHRQPFAGKGVQYRICSVQYNTTFKIGEWG